MIYLKTEMEKMPARCDDCKFFQSFGVCKWENQRPVMCPLVETPSRKTARCLLYNYGLPAVSVQKTNELLDKLGFKEGV